MSTTSSAAPSSAEHMMDTSASKQKLTQTLSSSSRMESMAYPKANTSTLLSKIQFCFRHNTRAVMATVAFVCFVLVVSSDLIHDSVRSTTSGVFLRGRGIGSFSSSKRGASNWGGAVREGYFHLEPPIGGATKAIHFSAVTDLDELSRVNQERDSAFQSFFQDGLLTLLEEGNEYMYKLSFEGSARTLTTNHNEAGRGAEFSELSIYNNRLLTFDDRTGDVFEILNNNDGTDSFVAPRFVITEGSGDTDKGMKWEWSTVKDGELYMGSMGKEYTDKAGNIRHSNNLWIAILDADGNLRREDWSRRYDVVRGALNARTPGYLIMEAVNWSPYLKKWVFLPRRISETTYDDVVDEKKGGNRLVIVAEDFSSAEVVEIKMESMDPLKGFSTFAFIPGTNDKHALAIRSVEEDCAIKDGVCKQRSYFLAFDVMTGKQLSEELQEEKGMKFEGVEFVNMNTAPFAL